MVLCVFDAELLALDEPVTDPVEVTELVRLTETVLEPVVEAVQMRWWDGMVQQQTTKG